MRFENRESLAVRRKSLSHIPNSCRYLIRNDSSLHCLSWISRYVSSSPQRYNLPSTRNIVVFAQAYLTELIIYCYEFSSLQSW